MSVIFLDCYASLDCKEGLLHTESTNAYSWMEAHEALAGYMMLLE